MIFEAVVEFFQTEKWSFNQLNGKSIVRCQIKGENAQWDCYAQAKEEEKQFIFYSVVPVTTPEEKRLDLAEFITRVNYGLTIGNYEMDFDGGEIRYKTSIDVDGAELNVELIRPVVYANITVTDKYLPGIMQVIYGNISPAEAVNAIES